GAVPVLRRLPHYLRVHFRGAGAIGGGTVGSRGVHRRLGRAVAGHQCPVVSGGRGQGADAVLRLRRSEVESYCTVRVKWNADEPGDVEVAHPDTFDKVVAILKQVRDRHADEYADALANDPDFARAVSGDVLGGFGVEIANRWGSIVEVGPGRDVWFL